MTVQYMRIRVYKNHIVTTWRVKGQKVNGV